MIVTRPTRSSPRFLPSGFRDENRVPSVTDETRSDLLLYLVGDTGIEPVTSSVSTNGSQASDLRLCNDLHRRRRR